MTISAQGVRAVYNGSGSTGPFTLQDGSAQAILFSANAEIVVTKFDDEGTPDVLTLTTDYTLTGAGSGSAGSMTLVEALAVGEKVVIQRVTPRTQTIDLLASSGRLDNEVLEGFFDKLIKIDIEDKDLQVTMDKRWTGGNLELPYPVAGRYLGWNSDGDGFDNLTLSTAFLSGSGAPSSGTGDDGDFYLDTSVPQLYGPKTAGAWGSGISLVGPQGEQGEQGPQGPAGAGTGDVVGPGSATDGHAALYDGATGKLLKSAGAAPYIVGGTDVAIADGGTGASTAAAAFSALKQAATEAATGVVEWATTAEVRAASSSADQVIRVRSLNEASAGVALTDAATVAVDWTAGVNFTLTVTANRAIGNPTNGIPGTWRTILVQGNDTTDRTITFGAQFLGEVPTITDCDSTRWYLLMIYCVSSTHFAVSSKKVNGT